MFSGIVTHQGTVAASNKPATSDKSREQTFAVVVPVAFCEGLEVGASVSCNGCCLTLKQPAEPTGTEAKTLCFGLSPETLARTTLGALQEGATINLERALKYGDEIGGHLVTGHIDGTASLIAIEDLGENRSLTFATDKAFAPMLAAKGGIALDGVSLTVNEVQPDPQAPERVCFSVMLIAHTLAVTTFGGLRPRDLVNLELDPMARYSVR